MYSSKLGTNDTAELLDYALNFCEILAKTEDLSGGIVLVSCEQDCSEPGGPKDYYHLMSAVESERLVVDEGSEERHLRIVVLAS